MPATPPNSPPRTQAALTSPSRASVTEALAASPPKCGSSASACAFALALGKRLAGRSCVSFDERSLSLSLSLAVSLARARVGRNLTCSSSLSQRASDVYGTSDARKSGCPSLGNV